VNIATPAALCGVLLLVSGGAGSGETAETFAAAPPPPEQAMAVSVVKAEEACLVDTLELPGTIVAREEIFVRPDADGFQIGRLLVEDGAIVRSGEPLAQLVRPDWIPGTPAKATVSAPASGTLAYHRLAVGMFVSPRGEPMFRIIRDGDLELVVEAPLGAFAKLEPGQPARIRLLDETELAGTIRVVLPQIAPQTQLGQARLKLLSSSGARIGAFATAAIDVGRSCAATIPLSAVLYSPQGAIVQVVRDDRIETRRVRTGLFGGQKVQIADGLSTGDVVIARAGAFLREGDPVRPVP
jgi:HlyD family secretion protein